MTELQVEEAIRQRWVEGWAVYHPTDTAHPDYVPYCFNDEAFDKPAGPWARVTLQWTVAEQTTQGQGDARKWNHDGVIFVQLFVLPNTGVAQLARMAHEARLVLQGRRIEDINIHEGASGGTIDGADYAMRPVTFRFTSEASG
jgi:hypothetical protein